MSTIPLVKSGLRALVINPGGTSTKIAVYRDDEELFAEDVRHEATELGRFSRVIDQLEWRLKTVRTSLSSRQIDLSGFAAVVGRGGPLAPVPSGTYAVDEVMLGAIRAGRCLVEHPSLLGAPMADALAKELGCPAFIVDPVCVDELVDEARLTGLPEIPRRALSHALNVKAAAREAAQKLGRPFEELCLIVMHLGSGFTVCAQRRGLQIDSNDATASGPLAPTRAGNLPALDFMRFCLRSGKTEAQLEAYLVGRSGWMAHLGTDDVRELYRRIETHDAKAARVLGATLYQLTKEAGAMYAVLEGRVDAVVLTGGVARSERFVRELIARLAWTKTQVIVVPGEREMLALAQGALRAVRGESEARSMASYLEPAQR